MDITAGSSVLVGGITAYSYIRVGFFPIYCKLVKVAYDGYVNIKEMYSFTPKLHFKFKLLKIIRSLSKGCDGPFHQHIITSMYDVSILCRR